MPYTASKPPAQATADTMARSGRRLTRPITTRIAMPVASVVQRIPRGDSIRPARTLVLDTERGYRRHDPNDGRGAGLSAARPEEGPALDHALAGPDVPVGVAAQRGLLGASHRPHVHGAPRGAGRDRAA